MKMRFTFCTKPVDEILLYNFTVISKYLAFRGSYSSSKPIRLISASQRSVCASRRPKTNFFMLIFTILLFFYHLICFVPNRLLYHQMHADILGQFKDFLFGLTALILRIFAMLLL